MFSTSLILNKIRKFIKEKERTKKPSPYYGIFICIYKYFSKTLFVKPNFDIQEGLVGESSVIYSTLLER